MVTSYRSRWRLARQRPAHAGRRPAAGALLAGLLAATVSLLAGGCISGTFRAAELPARFAAAPVERLDQIDLSRLTSYAVRSDRVDAGDVLEVTVFSDYGDAKTNPMPVRVADDGSANVPLIGPVPVAGLTLDSAERAIAAAAVQRDVYRSPHVTVTMDAQRKNRIIIVGAVQKPGVYEIPRGNSTLLAAIMEAGGLSEEASPEVAIRRPALTDSPPDPFRGETLRLAGSGGGVVLASYDENPAEQAQTVQVNLVSATTEGKGGYYLDDGDVVHVKKRPKRAFRVMGLVNAPGEIELPPDKDVYLLDALALAGERKMQAADSVLVIRRVEGQKDPIKIAISVNEAQNNGASNLRIQEDDVVVVRETPITMAFETLKTFFRFSVGSSLALF